MKNPRYLLLGATRKPYRSFTDFRKHETVNPLFVGSAEEVIAAAAAAPCAIFLVDLTSVPTAGSLGKVGRLPDAQPKYKNSAKVRKQTA